MIRLTKEARDRLLRFTKNPTVEELENGKMFLNGVEERNSIRTEIEKELVSSLKKLSNNDHMHILQIIDTIESIQSFINNVTYEEFIENDMLVSAVILKFEIMGETVKYISKEVSNKDSRINWKELIEYRNHLINNYFEIDLKNLWEKANNDLAKLNEELLILKDNIKD